jgi:sugar O-acyltransferase (sialic acid O-acetyltransferase NeuD family)
MIRMSKKKIVLLGGGGHCKSVLDSIISLGIYDEIGIVDYNKTIKYFDIEIVGTDEDLPLLLKNGWNEAFITVGSIGSTSIRHRLFSLVNELGFSIPTIIDPTAIIAQDVHINDGVFIGKRAVVNAGSTIGNGAIINTGAVIEHDCTIGDFSHISPGAILCGQVSISSDTHVGAGTVVRQGIEIGSSTMIGAGSVVVKSIPGSVTAYGNPCKVVRK